MDAGKPPAASTYPRFEAAIPPPVVETGRYTVRFARTAAEVDAIQKLRFEVFNLELGEGLEESYATERDRDRFDDFCHHLLVIDNRNEEVIGTYRMQTGEMARELGGFYSAEEFDLSGLPDEVMGNAIEIGRACVATPYRNRQVLFLLWKGLAAYLSANAKEYLFGCCSLTSQDPDEGRRVMRYLEATDQVHAEYRVVPRPAWACYEGEASDGATGPAEDIQLPKLFRLYMRYGAKVCGPPAMDRQFKTIDYLVLLGVSDLDDETRKMFFR